MNIFRPTKSDLRQIESLVKLSVSKIDIASVLGVSTSKLDKWEQKNATVSGLMKLKPRPEFTLNHPDFAIQVEEVFTCNGKRYYRFKDEFRMPTGRYKYHHAVLRELDLKMSLETLDKFIVAFKAVLNGGKKGRIEFTDLTVLLYNLESRVKLAFDVNTVKKLASVAYFDETEDLTSYSEKYGQEKIKIWEMHNHVDFFLTRQIGELLNVKNISVDSLEEHLNLMTGILTDLNSNLLKVQEDNS